MKMKCKLADLMKEQNISQKTLSEKTGLSPTTVGRLYRNHFDRIDNNTVVTLCNYFGIKKIDDLFELTDD